MTWIIPRSRSLKMHCLVVAACSLGRKPCHYPTDMVSREAAKARNPRRKPWVTECLRELSREAATAICA
jgi:hypothetical protein